MISRTTSATLSRNTSGCSDRMICSTASRAAVILWPSAIVVLLRQFLAGTDDHEARGGRTTLSPARLLHHFYRLDLEGAVRVSGYGPGTGLGAFGRTQRGQAAFDDGRESAGVRWPPLRL